jgi:hypothetical protein
MYSNDRKTDMILIYGESNKNASVVYADNKHFPKKRNCTSMFYVF